MHQIILSSLYRCLLTTFCFPGCEHFKCLNGGQCIYDESSNESKCECIDPWTGNNCHLNSGNAMIIYNMKEKVSRLISWSKLLQLFDELLEIQKTVLQRRVKIMAYARLQLIHLPAPANLGMRERTVASVRLNDTLFDVI